MTVSNKLRLPELVAFKKLPDIVTDSELASLIQGSDDRRYGLVKRALARGDLIHVRRGLYLLGDIYRKKTVNLFELGQRIYGPSYVSFESALSYWGLIPEAVYATTNASSGPSKKFNTPFGIFYYRRIPYHPLYFQVLRKEENQVIFFIATPFKAILDYIYVSKKIWDVNSLNESLRIEEIPKLAKDEFNEFKAFYQNWRVQKFLNDYFRRMY